MPKYPGRDRDDVALTAEIQIEQFPHFPLRASESSLVNIHIH